MPSIKDLQPGTYLNNQPFAVTKIEEKKTRDNKPYLAITLTDTSGQISAKVWSDALNKVHLDVGKVAAITGRVGEYQGNLDLTISQGHVLEDESFDNYLSQVPTMIFDIETVGLPFDELGEWDQQYILENLEKDKDQEEAKTRLGLYSLYGFVQSIGITDQTGRGVVLTFTDQNLKPENENFTLYTFKTEKELLQKFWELTLGYDRFVTFNGRGFDFPFLIIRSGINKVKIPMEIDDYNKAKFIDLAVKLSQGGRMYKLEAYCRAFGITNPKQKGVSGLHVSNLYHQGDHQAIADYVARDAVATNELYNIWREYLSGHLNF